MIQLQNIFKIFDCGKKNEKIALDNVSLNINDGEYVAIVGKSGAGKTTLLNILSCIDVPTEGIFKFDRYNYPMSSDDMAKIRHDYLGIITQNPFLLENATALENVVLPLRLNKISPSERAAKAAAELKAVGLENELNQKTGTMSGGEKQRVSIARALVNDPEVIIADEPTGSLDSENTQVIMKILTNINESGKTVIIVTHDTDIAKQCKRMITLSDGKIVSDVQNAPE